MSAVSRLRQVLGSAELTGIATLVALAGSLYIGGRWLLGPPALLVTTTYTRLTLPPELSESVASGLVQKSNPLSEDTASIRTRRVQEFLQSTDAFVTVTLQNLSENSQENVDVRIRGVRAVTGVSISGDFLTRAERDAILRSVQYDRETRLLRVGPVPLLTRKSKIEVHLWGDVSLLENIGGDPVIVTYDGGVGRIGQTSQISEANAFVYNNAALLFLIVVSLNGAWSAFRHRRIRERHSVTIATASASAGSHHSGSGKAKG